MATNFFSRWSLRKRQYDQANETAQKPQAEAFDQEDTQANTDHKNSTSKKVSQAPQTQSTIQETTQDARTTSAVKTDADAASDVTDSEGETASDSSVADPSASEISASEAPESGERSKENAAGGSSIASLLASDADGDVKKLALRSFFLSGEFHEVDELVDYGQDFTQSKKLSTDVASRLRNWMKDNDSTEDAGNAIADAQEQTPSGEQSQSEMASHQAAADADALDRDNHGGHARNGDEQTQGSVQASSDHLTKSRTVDINTVNITSADGASVDIAGNEVTQSRQSKRAGSDT